MPVELILISYYPQILNLLKCNSKETKYFLLESENLETNRWINQLKTSNPKSIIFLDKETDETQIHSTLNNYQKDDTRCLCIKLNNNMNVNKIINEFYYYTKFTYLFHLFIKTLFKIKTYKKNKAKTYQKELSYVFYKLIKKCFSKYMDYHNILVYEMSVFNDYVYDA